MQEIDQTLFEKQQRESKITEFGKFRELKTLLFQTKDAIIEGTSLNKNINFLKTQNSRYKDYEQFVITIRTIKNSKRLKKIEDKTIEELWREQYHLKNWEEIECISYKETSIQQYRELKHKTTEKLEKTCFIALNDGICNNQVEFEELENVMKSVSELILSHQKVREIFTSGIMSKDTQVYENHTTDIFAAIQNLEKIQESLVFLKRVQDHFNAESSFFDQEVCAHEKKELRVQWDLLQ